MNKKMKSLSPGTPVKIKRKRMKKLKSGYQAEPLSDKKKMKKP